MNPELVDADLLGSLPHISFGDSSPGPVPALVPAPSVSQRLRRAAQGVLWPARARQLHPSEFAYLDRIRQERRFVFVTGMHRSGTTFLAKFIAQHPAVSGFSDIPGNMDEGQFVQSVFPTDAAFGGTGYFGYHPRSRMIETSEARHAAIGVSLLKDWLVYLDRDAEVFIEKSPSNFRRSRLLAAVFPNASFIHVVRHPVVTALALKAFAPTAFGVDGRSVTALVRHWQHCQLQALSDYEVIRRRGGKVIVVALEDLFDVAGQFADAVRESLSLSVDLENFGQTLDPCPNDKYSHVFMQAVASHPELLSSQSLDRAFRRFGYSRTDPTLAPRYLDWLPQQRRAVQPAAARTRLFMPAPSPVPQRDLG